MVRRGPTRSLIIPMRDEAARIEATLERLATSSLARSGLEVVLVDDGSTDRTLAVVERALSGLPSLSCVVHRLEAASGKGAAVRTGMLIAQGETRAFVDADLPVELGDVERCFCTIESGQADLAYASRSHPASRVVRRQPLVRILVSRTFNLLVRALRLHDDRDTQCGLKGVAASAVAPTFGSTAIDGLAFDVEVLARARAAGLRAVPIPVTWAHVDAPRRRSAGTGLQAGRDVIGLRRRLSE